MNKINYSLQVLFTDKLLLFDKTDKCLRLYHQTQYRNIITITVVDTIWNSLRKPRTNSDMLYKIHGRNLVIAADIFVLIAT